MLRLISALVIGSLALAASGCVIVIGGDEDDDGFHTVHEYERMTDRNEDAAEELLDDLRDQFDTDSELRDEDISLSAWKSRVTLTGEASSAARLERAIDLVAADPRVETVESKVKVVHRN